jgi:hypothetical protein
MKLYTKEQLKEAFFEGINYAKSITPASMGFIEQYVAKKINLITPIELPNDEEIEKYADDVIPDAEKIGGINYSAYRGIKVGAKWMRDKLTKTKEK